MSAEHHLLPANNNIDVIKQVVKSIASVSDLLTQQGSSENIHFNFMMHLVECFENFLEDIILKQNEVMQPEEMELIIQLHSKLYANRLKINCLVTVMVSAAQNVERFGRIRAELIQLSQICQSSENELTNLQRIHNLN